MSTNQPTPLVSLTDLARQTGPEHLLVKREDQNASGSHKDRAIWPMLEHYIAQGQRNFVISSSGNAAISAAYFICHKSAELAMLHAFISPRMPADKRQRLDEVCGQDHKVMIHETAKAKSEAIKLAKAKKYQLIRTSTDDLALGGYKVLAKELSEQVGEQGLNIEDFDIYIPTSSGTTLQGLHEGFTELKHSLIRANRRIVPRLHCVQTAKVNIMAREFITDFEQTESSLAAAIVDTIGHRKDKVIQAVREFGGTGFVVSDEQLKQSKDLLKDSELADTSWDSLLALAGLQQNIFDSSNSILLFTGK